MRSSFLEGRIYSTRPRSCRPMKCSRIPQGASKGPFAGVSNGGVLEVGIGNASF